MNAPSTSDDKKSYTINLHSEINKTLITASSLVLTLSVAFLTSEKWPSDASSAHAAIAVALILLTLCVVAAVGSNNNVLSIAKKLAGTRFRQSGVNAETEQGYWDHKIHNATVLSNVASYAFAAGAGGLLLAGLAFLTAQESEFKAVFTKVASDVEATKKLAAPITWDRVARDGARQLYTLVLVDAAGRRLVCQATFGGKLAECRPAEAASPGTGQ